MPRTFEACDPFSLIKNRPALGGEDYKVNLRLLRKQRRQFFGATLPSESVMNGCTKPAVLFCTDYMKGPLPYSFTGQTPDGLHESLSSFRNQTSVPSPHQPQFSKENPIDRSLDSPFLTIKHFWGQNVSSLCLGAVPVYDSGPQGS